MTIIQQSICPGFNIIFEDLRSYNSIQTTGYTHQTVNHHNNFVDFNSEAHIQTFERM